MRLLDLFCGAGGAGRGYAKAGFEVYGVDLKVSPRSPHPVFKHDVMSLPVGFLRAFDAIHASPPCQRYSIATSACGSGVRETHPDLIEPLRKMLIASGRPYVIENVPGAPLHDPAVLCGSMFEVLRVRRHRLFETNWPLVAPKCGAHPKVYDSGKMAVREQFRAGEVDPWKVHLCVCGSFSPKAPHAGAMGIGWMSRRELAQAIPPAYTRYIGRQLMRSMLAQWSSEPLSTS